MYILILEFTKKNSINIDTCISESGYTTSHVHLFSVHCHPFLVPPDGRKKLPLIVTLIKLQKHRRLYEWVTK